MKLRTDLLAKLTPEMVEQAALASVHRYKPEPLFSRTGVGHLDPATEEDRRREEELSERIRRKLLGEALDR